MSPKGVLATALALVGLALATVACRPSEAEKVQYLLKNDPTCDGPCLSGILPGVTTEGQLQALIADGSRRQFDDLRINDNGVMGTRYSWRDRRAAFTVYGDVVNDRVHFLVLQTSPSISLDALIDGLGPPNYYSAEYGCGEQCGIWLYLFYEQLGLFTVSLIPAFIPPGEACHYTLAPEAEMRWVHLIPKLPVLDINAYLAPGYAFRFGNVQPWAGLELDALSCP